MTSSLVKFELQLIEVCDTKVADIVEISKELMQNESWADSIDFSEPVFVLVNRSYPAGEGNAKIIDTILNPKKQISIDMPKFDLLLKNISKEIKWFEESYGTKSPGNNADIPSTVYLAGVEVGNEENTNPNSKDVKEGNED